MRNTLLASASAVALTCTAALPAQAAPPPSPIYNWTGFYIGGNIGGGFGQSNPSLIANVTAAPFFLTGTWNTPGLNVQGFAGGGQFGYNVQTGNFVYGFETDFTGLDVHGSVSESPFFRGKSGVNTVTWSSRYSWLYTARFRGGLTIANNWLVYGTVGVGVTSVRDTATCVSPNDGCGADIGPSGPQFVEWSKTSTLVGAVYGGGVQAMPFPNWIFGLNVLHASFPSTSPGLVSFANTFGTGPVPPAFSFSHNLTLVTFQVDYKFGP
jgi:outer membrane immunogenic protein